MEFPEQSQGLSEHSTCENISVNAGDVTQIWLKFVEFPYRSNPGFVNDNLFIILESFGVTPKNSSLALRVNHFVII